MPSARASRRAIGVFVRAPELLIRARAAVQAVGAGALELSERGDDPDGVVGIGAWLGDVESGEILAGDGRGCGICRDIALRRRALRNGLEHEEVRAQEPTPFPSWPQFGNETSDGMQNRKAVVC